MVEGSRGVGRYVCVLGLGTDSLQELVLHDEPPLGRGQRVLHEATLTSCNIDSSEVSLPACQGVAGPTPPQLVSAGPGSQTRVVYSPATKTRCSEFEMDYIKTLNFVQSLCS